MNRDERRIKAENHVEFTQDAFKEETEYSYKTSTVYDDTKFNHTSGNAIPNITIEDMTSERAIKHWSGAGYKCAVLNFASFTRPGGGFIKGSIAQEEALCHASNLYDILKQFQPLYNINYNRMNDGLYTNWAIYTPDVSFIYNEGTKFEEYYTADIITCAAPNANTFLEKENNNTKYLWTLYERCKYVLDVAQNHNVKNLILGAFGCGVFGNNPEVVAEYFKDLLNSGSYTFEQVMFAIPEGKDNNLKSFKKIFN